ncbi:uncharacterized protein LOC144145373 isoform X3 [Haemaphysalis longicornis]
MARSIESLRADPKFGLDSTWSWVTAAFLSWVLLLAMICHQAMGVLFYGIVDTFGATRQAAAWPVVISGSLVSLAGPAMGYLCRRFSCQSVLIVSSIVMGTSASVCWFANSILFLTIMYGVIHGYFRDHHGSYNGLLHILAVMNGVLAVIWAIRLALRKRNEHAVQDKLKKATSSST